jgi:hypothetical protein
MPSKSTFPQNIKMEMAPQIDVFITCETNDKESKTTTTKCWMGDEVYIASSNKMKFKSKYSVNVQVCTF